LVSLDFKLIVQIDKAPPHVGQLGIDAHQTVDRRAARCHLSGKSLPGLVPCPLECLFRLAEDAGQPGPNRRVQVGLRVVRCRTLAIAMPAAP